MSHKLISISLFSGIGAFELASKLVFAENEYQTFQFVEINSHAQRVLRSQFPNIPVWSDICTYHPPAPRQLGFPTVVVGGFPCTGTSNAGKRNGLNHPESNLWWQMYRVILEFRPDFVIVENPEGIIHRGLQTILGAFKLGGYQTEVEIISAAELGAPHERNRVFVIGHCNNLSLQQRQGWRCWDEQVREHIAIARQIIKYPQTQPLSVPLDDGVSRYLAGLSYAGWWKQNSPPVESGVQPMSRGRREIINLVGRSIVPLQAAVALMRVKFLVELLG
ncbi:hypothetical protein A6S26_12675 [Nostoc sp. ATCC 43529]|nr:hypothetical protein A6S26_12675 [Nostoc sp. ATCC 43529]